jgi:pyruvate kinase
VAARRVGTWRPEKDELGRVTAQARVVIRRAGAKAAPADLRVADVALSRLRVGDALRFEDARGKARTLAVAAVSADEAVAWADKRGYVLDQASAQVRRGGRLVGTLVLEVCGEGDGAIDVQVGDALVLTRRQVEGRSPKRTKDGHVKVPGRIACTLPAALDRVAVGHRVLFDDGKIQAVVEQVHARRGELDLRVVRTSKARASLRAEKGINLPDTVTTVPSLTEDDLAALRFVARRADAVILSFVRRPSDVTALHAVLDRLGRPDLGVVLKIETRAGFEHLPRLLLAGLRRPTLAVMIARGDLAVEAGFERLAELQEEILWLCEASHVPVIWATQVLDTLARTGVPSRAEVTDAAASVAAECVMLNKGPFVDEAVKVLADILQRMETHHDKKRSLFRRLEVSSLSLE